MVQTFGLQKAPCIPDQDAVCQQLDQNEGQLFDVAQGMADGVRSQVNANSALLSTVDQRLSSSVNGHIRRNVGQLKPVMQGLADAVNIPLDQNEQIINGVVATPEIQDMMVQTPPQPAYGGTIPQVTPAPVPQELLIKLGIIPAPPPPNLVAVAHPAAAPAVPLAPVHCGDVVTPGNWQILLDCQGRQAIAVCMLAMPGQGNPLQSAIQAGWIPAPGVQQLNGYTESQVLQWLQANAAGLATLCAAVA